MFDFFRIIRPINLLVIAITQALLFYLIIYPSIVTPALQFGLNIWSLGLLILCTILLAAGSYIINDIYDIEIDKINKLDKQIVTKTMSINTAKYYYYCINITGFLIAIYLALSLDRLSLIWIYPVAILGLFYYAKKWKKKLFIGNLVVALFSAFVAIIIYIYAYGPIHTLKDTDPGGYLQIRNIMGFYISFAFLTSLYREIVKDMQDIKGDKEHGVQSIPITYGIPKAKQYATSILIILISLLLYWIYTRASTIPIDLAAYLLILGVILPLIWMVYRLGKATSSRDYKRISTYTKIIMLIGIIYLFLL